MELKHISIHVSGIVQNVGFRFAARKMAITYGIKGYVKNLPDGSLCIEAEGSPMQLQYFLAWCKEGPSNARVNDISTFESEVIPYNEFFIKH
jgi:acylphosphatase